jgi:integrase
MASERAPPRERSPSLRPSWSWTENTQHLLALDPFTLATLKTHVDALDQERRHLGSDYLDDGWLFCWENDTPPHPDTITRRLKRLGKQAGMPEIGLHDVRHSYATRGATRKSTGRRYPSGLATPT